MTIEQARKLTGEQEKALFNSLGEVSLSAGAGCGKTFVLTERFISYLDPRILERSAEIPELVAITFTEAAAREMRDRIRRRCYERLQTASEPEEKRSWQNLIRSLEQAQISTIHSFCTSVLRRFAPEARIDPRFEVLNGPAAELLRLQALDDRLRYLLLERDPNVLDLATHFELRSLRNHIATILGATDASFFETWAGVEPEAIKNAWVTYYQEHHLPRLRFDFLSAEAVQQLQSICTQAEVNKPQLANHLEELDHVIKRIIDSGDFTRSALELRNLAKTQGITTKKDWSDEQAYANYRDTCKAVRDLIDKGAVGEVFDPGYLLDNASLGAELLELVADVRDCYERVKTQRNYLEFDDLLSRTHELLTSQGADEVRKRLGQSMKLLMVDEFQDTDSKQVAIVRALCGDEHAELGLFVVGDFKQSIYRFRGAEPQVSHEMQESLSPESRLSLTVNFRSQPDILDFVNALFCDTFSSAYEPLQPFRKQLTPTPSVEFLWASSCSEEQDGNRNSHYSRAQADRACEAQYIARRLAQMIDRGDRVVIDADSKKPRSLLLGDIAILLRSLSDVSIYETALREVGLDYYLAGGHAFYSQQEIYDLLHLLRTISSPADELSLAGALRSPFFSLEDELLHWLVETHGSLNEGLRLQQSSQQITKEQRARIERAADTIGCLRELKDQSLVSDLLTRAIETTGYDAVLMCEFLGDRKLANVEKLIDQAREYDQRNPGDLDGFITQLSEFVLRAPKEAVAASNAEGNVIRIMTIHHAKGLEFPLVVVPDLNRQSPRFPSTPVFDRRLGPLVPPEKDDQNTKYCVGWSMYRYAEQQEELDERKRLLYVACTRASDYLILSSSFKDLERELDKPRSDWLQFIHERFDLRTGACRVDLPSDYRVPQLRVTRKLPELSREPTGRTRGVDIVKLVDSTRSLATGREGSIPVSVAPIPIDYAARRSFSFSQISGVLQKGVSVKTRDDDLSSASDAQEARGIGTLVHAVLEQVDFPGNGNVKSMCEQLAPLHVESNWTKAVDDATQMIGSFLKSERAESLAAAQAVHREVEFLMPWKRAGTAGNGYYIHGYIDCLYQDKDGVWHLLDYKTNQVSAQGVPEVARNYELQLFVYSLACEQVLHTPLSESALCFLRPSREFVFARDAKSDAEYTRLIDQSMDLLLASDETPVGPLT